MEELSNELEQSKYCYQNTKTLINKKNIKDHDRLIEIENGITAFKLSKLYLNDIPYKQTFDIYHYLSIHEYLFGDLYPFAGTIRDENIYKSNEPYKSGKTPFCEIPFIVRNLKYTLEEMKQNVVKIKDKETLGAYLGKYYLDLNIIHPFREGNGRTLREFLREYVIVINKILKTNYYLDYNLSKKTKNQLLKASILDDEELAIKVFSKIIKTEEERKIKK